MKHLFFDTETTGKDADDVLCQLAFKTESEIFCELYKPAKSIPPEASAVHHISNKMVADKPSFAGSADYARIKELFESDDVVVVAHNATFDLGMLNKEGIVPKNFICTLRISRAMDPQKKLKRYNLQYLRYALDFDIEAQAHDALGDVLVLEVLFGRLFDTIKAGCVGGASALEKMIEISSHPSLFEVFDFGKYNGKKIADIAKTDAGYLQWLLSEKMKNEPNEEDWIYTLKQNLGIA